MIVRERPGRRVDAQWVRALIGAPARIVLAMLAIAVLALGVETGIRVIGASSSPGFIATSSGRIISMDPDGAAARSGLRPGDRIAAVDGPGSAVNGLGPLVSRVRGDYIPVTVGKPGGFSVFWILVSAPSSTQIAGDAAALLAACALWLSGVRVLYSRGGTLSALYAGGALLLALSIVAIVAREYVLPWSWPVLVPAALAGLTALLLTQCGLAGWTGRWIIVAGAAFIGVSTAVSTLLGAVVPSAPIDLACGAAAALPAAAVVIVPLVRHGPTLAVSAHRRLRVAFIGAIAGLLPAGIWAAVAAIDMIGTVRILTPIGSHVSDLWLTAGFIPMSYLYAAVFAAGDLRRIERRTLRGAAAVTSALLALGLWLTRSPRPTGPALVVVGIGLAALALLIDRSLAREIAAAIRRTSPDYDAATRIIEQAALENSGPAAMARAVAMALSAPLRLSAVVIGLRDRAAAGIPFRAYDGADEWQIPDDEPTMSKLDSSDTALCAPVPHVPGRGRPDAAPMALWAPLRRRDASYGAFILVGREGDDVGRELDQNQVMRLARLFATALHADVQSAHATERSNVLAALNRRLARAHEEERANLARELHDVVAQEIIALTRHLRRYGNGATPPPAIWADMVTGAQDALVATRRICNGLRPAILDLGLTAALRELVASISGEHGPKLSLSVEGQERQYDTDLELALYRVAQEGLHNAVAHAGATQVLVALSHGANVRLTISDNGRGFIVPAHFEDLPGDHLGLIGMRERIALQGGRLDLASTPGQGTVLEALVPHRNP